MSDILFDAARDGDLEAVQSALAEGEDPRRKNEFGHAVLAAAITGGSVEVFDALVDAGATLDDVDAPFMNASSEPMIARLHALGADINGQTASGESALIRAVANNPDVEVVRRLLDDGAAIELENDDGWTALCFAAHWDDRWDAINALLLERGADVNHVTHEGWTPMLLACHSRIVDKGPIGLYLEVDALDINARTPPLGGHLS